MKKLATVLLLATMLVPAWPQSGKADDWHHDHGAPPPVRHDDHLRGDIRHFDGHEARFWHSGHWFRGPHSGRNGWWWVVGDGWYFYPAPVYPYPNPYTPPVVAAGPVNYWYYCRNPRGYYPYVAVCSRPWQAIPAY